MSHPELPVGKRRQQVYDECQTFRHWWQPTTVVTEGQFYIQHMVCLRCTMERRWRVNRVTGDPMGNNYTPPPDYYRHKSDAQDRQQARKELRLSEIERHRRRRRTPAKGAVGGRV